MCPTESVPPVHFASPFLSATHCERRWKKRQSISARHTDLNISNDAAAASDVLSKKLQFWADCLSERAACCYIVLLYMCICAFEFFFFHSTCVYCVCLLQVDQQLWLIAAIKCRRLIAQHLQPVMINIFPGSHRWVFVGHDIVWWLMTPPFTQALKSLFIDVFARFAPFWPHNNTPTTDNVRII